MTSPAAPSPAPVLHFVADGAAAALCGLPATPSHEDSFTESAATFRELLGLVCKDCERPFRIAQGLPVEYLIPADNREAVEERVKKLNRKAAKLGVPGVTISLAHHHTETWKVEKVEGSPEFGFHEYSREWLSCQLAGTAVRLAGWAFIATLHHTTDGNIIASVPGNEVPREYRNAPSACAHCRTTRRRSATYLLQEDATARVVQVGSDCLQDFLGNDPHRMAAWAEALGAFNSWFVSTMEEEGGRGPRPVDTFSLGSFLEAACAHIRIDGWVSRKLAQESERTSTASEVWSYLNRRIITQEDRERATKYRPTDEDKALAVVVLNWARETMGEPRDDMNDYEHNLGVIVRAGLVSHRTAGLAASLVQGHRRATQVEADKEAAKNAPESNHVGVVGERMRDVPVTVLAVIPMPPTDFGPRVLLKVVDDAGNLLVWFTGSVGRFMFASDAPATGDTTEAEDYSRARAPEPKDRMWLTGTVKEHSSFAGKRQTVLSRCALASVAPAPKKAKKSKKEAV